MFTGIIQNLGKAINFTNGYLEVTTSLDLSDCNVGSSICCNGARQDAVGHITKRRKASHCVFWPRSRVQKISDFPMF